MTDRDSARDREGNNADEPAIGAGVVHRFRAFTREYDVASPLERRQLPDRLARAVEHVLPVDGTAISVYLGADIVVPVGASTPDAARAEALQFTLHEGPCLASYTSHGPVIIPDINPPQSRDRSRWPTYSAELIRHTPYRAAFAFPLLIGRSAVGSLSLYRRSPGTLHQLRDITAIAELVTDRLLDAEVLAGLDGETEHPWITAPATERRHQVWTAQGMTMIANKITATEALDLLRAHAYTAERLLDDVAGDITDGHLPVPTLTGDQ
jgi:hypothetical protein